MDSILNDDSEDIRKSFFGDIINNIKDFFSKVKDKLVRIIQNIVCVVESEAKILYFKSKGVKRYAINLSDNDNTCDKCKEMSGKSFSIDEFKIGDTAPPFHPNCGCTITEKTTDTTNMHIDDNQINALIASGSITLPQDIIPRWLYNVVLPKVIDSVFIQKITKNNPLYEPIKAILLLAGTKVLDLMKCPISKAMYTWGIIGNGQEMPHYIKDLLINKYRTSSTVKNAINNCLRESKNRIVNVAQMDIYFNEERDLYYSIGSSNLSVSGFKKPNGKWNLNIKIGDLYDFEFWELNELKHSNFTVYVNDLGYAMQVSGMMVQYDTTVEFNLEDYDFGG